MRRAVIVLAALGCMSVRVSAEQQAGAQCSPVEKAFGESRVVELDTSGGARYGEQYPGNDFLAPGEVVLTFDDGPLRRYTLPVLDALDAHCAKATFFVVGRMAIADPDMLRDVANRGHTVATHTWSHRNIRTLGTAAAQKEIELGVSAASKVIGRPVAPFFRFPYLSDSRNALAYFEKRNFGVFSIDIDTKDYRTRGAGQVEKRVLDGLAKEGKGIILFHDIQASTARAIKDLLGELKARGYKIVHITPKAPAKTVAEYDAVAEQMLERKTLAAAASAVAARAVTWPMADGEAKDEPAVRKTSLRRSGSGRRASARRQKEQPAPDQPDAPLNIFGQ